MERQLAIAAKDNLLAAAVVKTGRTLWTLEQGRQIKDEFLWGMLVEAQTTLTLMQPPEVCKIMLPEMFYGVCEASLRIRATDDDEVLGDSTAPARWLWLIKPLTGD